MTNIPINNSNRSMVFTIQHPQMMLTLTPENRNKLAQQVVLDADPEIYKWSAEGQTISYIEIARGYITACYTRS